LPTFAGAKDWRTSVGLHPSKSLHAAHGAFLIAQSLSRGRQDCQLLLAQKIGGPLWGCIQVNPSMLRMARFSSLNH